MRGSTLVRASIGHFESLCNLPINVVGTCRLCLAAQVDLRASHIVPEFFYRRVYTKSHKLAAISKDSNDRLAVEQNGYREHLLCQCCETKLSKWEGKLSQLINEISNDVYGSCTVKRIANVISLSGIEYHSIKMAVLSIFWRMGIASHNLFFNYILGPYAEKLRLLLNNDISPTRTEFPVLISKGLIDGVFQTGILFPAGRGRYDNALILQSVVLNGIVFDCVMTDTRTIPEEIVTFALDPAGHVMIPSRPYEELGFNVGEIAARMKSNHVTSFFARYN